MQSVASITISYNSKRVLASQFDALVRQSYALSEIIVVDNASTDGTCEMLAERYPQVTVIRLAENIGAAGAWAAGMKYAALEKRHDWIWAFDDDSVPDEATLEALLEGWKRVCQAQPEVAIVAPLPVDPEGEIYPPYLWREGFVKAPRELLQQPVWFADLVIASGCLVRREVVEKIGLPRADFFMDVFDFEYCLRARSQGFRIVVVNAAKLMHEVGNARQIRLPRYSLRWTQQAPWREYYISRNLAYLAWWLYPTRGTRKSMARYLLIHAVQVLLFSSKKLACCARIAQGIFDGVRASLGVRVRPN